MAIHTPAIHPKTTARVNGLGWAVATILGIVILTAALLLTLPAGPTSSASDRELDHSGLRGDWQEIMGYERGHEGSGLRR